MNDHNEHQWSRPLNARLAALSVSARVFSLYSPSELEELRDFLAARSPSQALSESKACGAWMRANVCRMLADLAATTREGPLHVRDLVVRLLDGQISRYEAREIPAWKLEPFQQP